jgi:hypothetical protein
MDPALAALAAAPPAALLRLLPALLTILAILLRIAAYEGRPLAFLAASFISATVSVVLAALGTTHPAGAPALVGVGVWRSMLHLILDVSLLSLLAVHLPFAAYNAREWAGGLVGAVALALLLLYILPQSCCSAALRADGLSVIVFALVAFSSLCSLFSTLDVSDLGTCFKPNYSVVVVALLYVVCGEPAALTHMLAGIISGFIMRVVTTHAWVNVAAAMQLALALACFAVLRNWWGLGLLGRLLGHGQVGPLPMPRDDIRAVHVAWLHRLRTCHVRLLPWSISDAETIQAFDDFDAAEGRHATACAEALELEESRAG